MEAMALWQMRPCWGADAAVAAPPRLVLATTSDELMTHTVLLYVMDIHVFQYMYVCMAGKWVFNDFLLEQDGRNRTGDTSLYYTVGKGLHV